MSDISRHSSEIRAAAAEIGFDSIGIAPAVSPPGYHRLLDWLAKGYAADMDWIESRREAYASPAGVFPGTVSVIMVALNYHEGTRHGEGARVSRYAWGEVDYHDVIRFRLRQLAERVRKVCPAARTRAVVDTAPLLEREYARIAGIGWFGKNTMLISRRIGSWFFLGAVLTDALLEYDQPHATDHCGTCTRCLDACPTQAFPEPGVLDAGRCISYLTIERRTQPVPENLRRDLGPWLFGCDVCQDVCPWNRFAPQTCDAVFRPAADLSPADCRALLKLGEAEFQARFHNTPLARAGRAGLLRNAALVIGNLQDRSAEPELLAALNDPEPLIRGASAWALGQLGRRSAVDPLSGRLNSETEDSVRSEIRAALSRVS